MRAEWPMYTGGVVGIICSAIVGGTIAYDWPGWAQSLVVLAGVTIGLGVGAAIGIRIEFGTWRW